MKSFFKDEGLNKEIQDTPVVPPEGKTYKYRDRERRRIYMKEFMQKKRKLLKDMEEFYRHSEEDVV